MKKCLFSKYIKLPENDFEILCSDIEKFNTMKRIAFSLVKEYGGDKPVLHSSTSCDDEDLSIHLYLKEFVDCNDYFRNSAREEAKSLYKSAMETLQLHHDEIESQIAQMDKKLKELESRLKHLTEEKESLIARSRNQKLHPGRKIKFKSYKGGNETEQKDGSFKVHKGRKTYVFENQYLFEINYLNPEIKQLKSKIRLISQRRDSAMKKLDRINQDIENHSPHVCFGSRKLFKKQFTVYDNHDDWNHVFQKARNKRMIISGRKDAAYGNFVVHYDIISHSLVYTSMNGKKIIMDNVVFPYGQEYVDFAVSAKKPERKAVAWTFEVHGRKILAKCTVELPDVRMNNYYKDGCIAFDTNVDHFAVAEIDGNGNLLQHKIIKFNIRGKSSEQIEHILSKALEQVFDIARKCNKPLAMEDLENIEQEYLYQGKRLNEVLSSFAYSKITALAESKSYKYCINLMKVSPAFTSQIGKVKYLRRNGLSVHEAAAYTIARRALGFKEKLPSDMRHLIPEANKRKHHWSQWRLIHNSIKEYKPEYFYAYIPYKQFNSIKEMNKYFSSIPEQKQNNICTLPAVIPDSIPA